MARWLAGLAGMVSLAIAFAPSALAAPGDLDTSFSDDGKLTVDFGGKTGVLADVAIQPDGKIVLVGNVNTNSNEPDFVVMRLNADGTPDSGFADAGTLVLDIPLNTQRAYNVATAVALQSDGKIVVGGYSRSTSGTIELQTIVRLQANGALDSSFTGDGSNSGPGIVADSLGMIYDLELDSQGRILAAGTWEIGSDSEAFLERYLAGGPRDAGFDSPAFGWSTGTSGAGAIALQEDQRVVIAGYTSSGSNDAAVARAGANGGLDTAFSGDGLFTYGLGAGASDQDWAVVVQPDGKIDLAGEGTTGNDFTLTRLTSAGAPDDSLAGQSTVTADFGGSADFGGYDSAYAMALQANGKILLAGEGAGDMAFARFQPGGSPDDTFGSGGKRTVSFPNREADVAATALQSDGNIVAVGTLYGGVWQGAVVRLQGDSETEGGAPSGSGGEAKTYRCGGKRATIVGTNKRNKLRGTRRADVIVGLGGNDTIRGLGGNDIACGGGGNDKVSGGSGKDKLYGDSGKDRLAGDSGNDRESGGSGNDKLLGGSGKDVLGGGSGKDGLSGGSGNDKLNGNAGKDKLNGGGGNDGCAGKDREASC